MTDFAVDPVIQSLTYMLADWPLSRVFLYNDSRYHWGLLVPRRAGVIEMCDLSAADQAQLMAEAVGTPVKIDAADAALTRQQVGSHMAGWFQFQPLWARIVREQPDLLE